MTRCRQQSSVSSGHGGLSMSAADAAAAVANGHVQRLKSFSPVASPIARYVEPEEFAELAEFATKCGIERTVAGPLVRSSYHADGQAQMIREIRKTRSVS